MCLEIKTELNDNRAAEKQTVQELKVCHIINYIYSFICFGWSHISSQFIEPVKKEVFLKNTF